MNRWRIILSILLVVSIAVVVYTSIQSNHIPELVRTQPPWAEHRFDADRFKIPAAVSLIGGMASLYVFSVILVYLIPQRMMSLSSALANRPAALLRVAGTGLLSLLLLGALTGGASLWIGTFPLAIFVVLAVILASTIGGLAMAFRFGRGLLRRAGWPNRSPFLELLVGTLILFPLMYLPYVGGILMILFICLGLGLNIITRFGSNQPWSIRPIIEVERGNS